jgi:hypothetical protein
VDDYLENEKWLLDVGYYDNSATLHYQNGTPEMCASMSVQTPADTRCDVNSDSGEGSDSPSQFSYSATVPPLFLTNSYSNEASSSSERLPIASSTTPPSITGSSPSNACDPHFHAFLQAARQGSPVHGPTLKPCELCRQQFNGSEQLA